VNQEDKYLESKMRYAEAFIHAKISQSKEFPSIDDVTADWLYYTSLLLAYDTGFPITEKSINYVGKKVYAILAAGYKIEGNLIYSEIQIRSVLAQGIGIQV
jgi:hypothetical protein